MRSQTKFIGIKEFRQNLSEIARSARSSGQQIVVMNRNRPLFAVTPFAEDAELSSLIADITEAQEDVAAGRVYTHAQVKAELLD